jgi:two-component system, chemotaxis family, sensor kinase CheA
VTFFSDERANELRSIFFESAQELLQALNDEGLLLEKSPSDPEIIRNIRRTVHTLKGDSAACGYHELSDLAHALEDVLTPEMAATSNGSVAELVLSVADMFDEMLSAYRGNVQPPSGEALLAIINNLSSRPETVVAAVAFPPAFNWTEYERLVISQSAVRGQHVYNIGLQIDPQCPMRAAALQLIRNVLQEAGTVLVTHPEESTSNESIEVVELALATHHQCDWILKKAAIPTVVSRVHVNQYPANADQPVAEAEIPSEPDVLGLLNELDGATVIRGSESRAAEASKGYGLDRNPAPSALENILRVDADRIDNVLDLLGELIIGKSMLNQAVHEFSKRFPKDPVRTKLTDALSFQSQVLNKLQRSVMKIRMVPVEQLFRRFPRVVRDIAKQQGKAVELVLAGESTDLDKSILDALAEPLTHLVRNAVDHGIETPEERTQRHKPAEGTIKLNAYHQGNQVVIEISDDGRGIDRDKLLRKAIEKDIVSKDDAGRLNDSEILSLVFHAGLSTADTVTHVSGRGVGMDIVKGVMDRLKGSVAIESEVGVGTTFRLKLPLTLAIIKALLFRASERLYAIPLGSVLEITRSKEADIHVVDKHEVVQLRGEVLTLVRLSRLSRSSNGPDAHGRFFIVVITLGDRKFGLVVDNLVGEEELVIKALDDSAIDTDLISGASVLGDGTVVLILNLSSVVQRLSSSFEGKPGRARKVLGALA